MFQRVTSFIFRVIRNEITDELEKKLDLIDDDIHEILEWQAAHAHSTADNLALINQRISRIEQYCKICKREDWNVLPTGE